jgi:hypothetical protein
VDETKADTVRRIFEWATSGCGCKQIVTKLNEQRIPSITVGTRKNCRAWNPTFVQKLITGRAVLGSESYPGIIDPLTYEIAQAALKSHTRHKGNQGKDVPNLFTGLLFDARTKEPMRRTGGSNGDYLTSLSSPFGWRYQHFEVVFLKHFLGDLAQDRPYAKSLLGQLADSIWILIEEYQPKIVGQSKRSKQKAKKLPFFRIASVQVRWISRPPSMLILWRRGTKWGDAHHDAGDSVDLRNWNGKPLYGSYDRFPALEPVIRHLYQQVESSEQLDLRSPHNE